MKSTLSLILLVLLAIAGIWYLDPLSPTTSSSYGGRRVFGDISFNDIKKVTIKRREEEFHFLPREESNGVLSWKMENPAVEEVNTFRIRSLMAAILEFELFDPFSPDTENLEQYGFDETALSLTIETVTGAATILFGKESEFLGGRYAQIADKETIALVPNDLFDAANYSSGDFRERQPITYQDEELLGVSFTGSGERFELTRESGGAWKMIQPQESDIVPGTVQRLSQALRGLVTKDFYPSTEENLKRFRLTEPDYLIELHLQSGQDLSLSLSGPKIGREQASTYLYSGGDTIYEILPRTIPGFQVNEAFFRAEPVFPFFVSEIRGVVLKQKERELRLESASKKEWLVNDQPGDTLFIDRFLTELTELKPEAFAHSSGEFGFGDPFASMTVTTNERSLTLIIGSLFPASGLRKGRAAKVAGSTEVLLFEETTLRALFPSAEKLQVVDEAPEEL